MSRYLGGRFARELVGDSSIERVIGVDVVPPREDLGAAEFVRADIRNPVIAKVIASEQVDTVVHMSVSATPAKPLAMTTAATMSHVREPSLVPKNVRAVSDDVAEESAPIPTEAPGERRSG